MEAVARSSHREWTPGDLPRGSMYMSEQLQRVDTQEETELEATLGLWRPQTLSPILRFSKPSPPPPPSDVTQEKERRE